MNNSREWDFLDFISLMSFGIALENLDMNITQEDMQQADHNSAMRADKILQEIHSHLEQQDDKIDIILKRLEELENGSERNIQQDSKPYDRRTDDT